MSNKVNLRDKWQGLTDTVMRFPLTVILLVAAVVTNLIAIESEYEIVYTRLLISFLLGAAVFVVLQMLYERFLDRPVIRIVFMLVAVACSVIYYMVIRNAHWRVDVTVRTIVIWFLLLICFLWIPSIRSRISINETIMAVVKSLFTSLFFDGVLFLGTVAIISATDLLIFEVSNEAYIHSANIIFVLLAPVYFLSMIPLYPGKGEDGSQSPNTDGDRFSTDGATAETLPEEDRLRSSLVRMITPSKFLESLITFVIIPITAVFTIILLLYLVINIRGEFWTDNLMEPMLVSYSITVIIVYLLSSTIQKPMARYFRLIFPKVLIPIVLFQTLSSVLKISDVGVTYGRYYVILFGVFATAAGALFSFLPVRKNGIIAPILLVLAFLSILPPVDAFTLSRVSQEARLEKVLVKNKMLSEGAITPKTDISEEDKDDIISSLDYLDRMEYTRRISYLKSYSNTFDFEKTFGFDRYDYLNKDYKSYYYSRNTSEPIPITGFDTMLQVNIGNMSEVPGITLEIDGSSYTIGLDTTDQEKRLIILRDSQGQDLIRYEMDHLFTKFTGTDSGKDIMTSEEMTFRTENERAALTIIANYISYNEWAEGKDKSADLIILVDIR
jgi:hypothetical protein